ncbi:MAG: GNAT family N-acetyltransferase [Clostridia bacterium]|nr:GNAT family N-acetyltransferase [Clostridia bacterium]
MSGNIRKAAPRDISRIAEILVFVKRIKFRPIFRDDMYSFGELQVLTVAEKYARPELLDNILVYDDGIVKGLIHIEGNEIAELYVDWFFQNMGIGSRLIEYAKANCPVSYLWAIEKNTDAIRFYEAHGFRLTGKKKFEEGTAEYLVMMERE